MQSMTLPLLYETVNISKYYEQKYYSKDGTRTMGQAIIDFLNNIIAAIKNIFGTGLSETNFNAAIQDLKIAATVNIEQDHNITNKTHVKKLEKLTNVLNKGNSYIPKS